MRLVQEADAKREIFKLINADSEMAFHSVLRQIKSSDSPLITE